MPTYLCWTHLQSIEITRFEFYCIVLEVEANEDRYQKRMLKPCFQSILKLKMCMKIWDFLWIFVDKRLSCDGLWSFLY